MKSFRDCSRPFWLVMCGMLICSAEAPAQWSNDPRVNTVWEQNENQGAPLICTDDEGGAIVTWGSERGIFANRVDKFGYRQWGSNGAPVSPPAGFRTPTNIIPDGLGGAVIVWEDFTKSFELGVPNNPENEMYVQRVDRQGRRLWDSSGVIIRERIEKAGIGDFEILSDDYQTFMISWFDQREPWQWYVQRIDAYGQVAFEPNGRPVPIESFANNARRRVVSDGKGGMLMTRFRQNANQTAAVDKITKEGEFPWPTEGISVNTGGAFATTSDGQGGAIIAGVYFTSPSPSNVAEGRIQRIDSAGSLLWGENGKTFTPDADVRTVPHLVNDNDGGALVTWDDTTGGQRQRFVARFNSRGKMLWKTQGFRIWYHSTIAPTIIGNDKGSMIWLVVDFNTTAGDLFAFKVDSNGTVPWGMEGVLIRHRDFEEWPYFLEATRDEQGGFIAVWSERRPSFWQNLALQQVSVNGKLGEVVTSVHERHEVPTHPQDFVFHHPFPNPLQPTVNLSFYLRKPSQVLLRVVNLTGQEIVRLVDQPLAQGNHAISWDGRSQNKKEVVDGIYFCQLFVDNVSQVRKVVVLH